MSFHTEHYRSNFVQACARLLGGDGVTVRGTRLALPDGRLVSTTARPSRSTRPSSPGMPPQQATGREIQALGQQFAGRTLLLGVDRLDYTKGIVERLLAVEMLLERCPELRTTSAFLQVAVPSRDDVREYRNLRADVERHIGRINGRFTEPGHDVPVHYLYRGLPQQQLAAYYAVAAALLVTPLIDGMNLVAKEYVTVQHARQGSGSPRAERVHRRRG